MTRLSTPVTHHAEEADITETVEWPSERLLACALYHAFTHPGVNNTPPTPLSANLPLLWQAIVTGLCAEAERYSDTRQAVYLLSLMLPCMNEADISLVRRTFFLLTVFNHCHLQAATLSSGLVRACVRSDDEDATYARSVLVQLCERASSPSPLHLCVEELRQLLSSLDQPLLFAAGMQTVTSTHFYV